MITDPGGDEFAGSMLFQHPLLQSEDYNGSNGDKKYRDTCCDPRLGGEYCHYFFDFRRYSHKKSYTPPALGKADLISIMSDEYYLKIKDKFSHFLFKCYGGRFCVSSIKCGSKV